MAEAEPEPEPKPKHDESESLIVWSLGAFHAATLVAVLVALGHTAGALGDLLGGLNTVVGLALYLLLWGLSWGATRSVLARVPPATIETGGVGAAVAWGALGGAGAGMAFLVGVVLVAIIPALLGGIEPLSVVLILLIGGTVAAVVGAIVGGLFALVDVALFRLAVRVGDPSPE